MADMLTKCPKCGNNVTTSVVTTSAPMWCSGRWDGDEEDCLHGSAIEHLYTWCQCGYQLLNVRPYLDAEKKNGS